MTPHHTLSLLSSADSNTMWGSAVLYVLDAYYKTHDYSLIEGLLEQLRSQYKDSPSVMLDCFNNPVKELLEI